MNKSIALQLLFTAKSKVQNEFRFQQNKLNLEIVVSQSNSPINAQPNMTQLETEVVEPDSEVAGGTQITDRKPKTATGRHMIKKSSTTKILKKLAEQLVNLSDKSRDRYSARGEVDSGIASNLNSNKEKDTVTVVWCGGNNVALEIALQNFVVDALGWKLLVVKSNLSNVKFAKQACFRHPVGDKVMEALLIAADLPELESNGTTVAYQSESIERCWKSAFEVVGRFDFLDKKI